VVFGERGLLYLSLELLIFKPLLFQGFHGNRNERFRSALQSQSRKVFIDRRYQEWQNTDRQTDSYIHPQTMFAGGIMKTWPYKMVATPEEDNLVVF
jgi:hypothetical protein